MKDPDDVKAYQDFVQCRRVHIFIVRLDAIFEQFRGEILHEELVLDLEECYTLVEREALRRATMKMEPENTESSVMVVSNQSTQNWQHQNKENHAKTTTGVKSTYKCTHCNQNDYTKDCCFEIIGYPEWWDHNRDSRKKNSLKSPIAATIESKSKYSTIERSFALVTTTSVIGKALNISENSLNNTWIIDFGATNHMTFDSRQVCSLKPHKNMFALPKVTQLQLLEKDL